MTKLIIALLLIVGGIVVGRALMAMAAQVRAAGNQPVPWITVGRAVQVVGVARSAC